MAVAIPWILGATAAVGAKAVYDTKKSQDRSEQAVNKNIADQRATVARQEATQAQQQSELAQRAQTAMRAKRGGGLRSLLSGQETGLSGVLDSASKLGGGV